MMYVAEMGGAEGRLCRRRACRSVFVPNKVGRPRVYCGRVCAVKACNARYMWRRTHPLGILINLPGKEGK